jgi:hypothetical protein
MYIYIKLDCSVSVPKRKCKSHLTFAIGIWADLGRGSWYHLFKKHRSRNSRGQKTSCHQTRASGSGLRRLQSSSSKGLICNYNVIRDNNDGSVSELTQATVRRLFEVVKVKGLNVILEILRMDPGTLLAFCPACLTRVETYTAMKVKDLQAEGEVYGCDFQLPIQTHFSIKVFDVRTMHFHSSPRPEKSLCITWEYSRYFSIEIPYSYCSPTVYLN